jgi:hypothetical protein
MKKILIFTAFVGFFAVAAAHAGVRDGGISTSRTSNQSRTTTVVRTNTDSPSNDRIVQPTRTGAQRNTRAGVLRLNSATVRQNSDTGSTTARTGTFVGSTRASARQSRSATNTPRATTNAISVNETQTGAAYNQCKSAYFQCMDQFCLLKNDDYRRCSCSGRISDLIAFREKLVDANTKLAEFTENLDMVGMTAAQATAIHTATEGENAITSDLSASKALLAAIMNSIRGDDANVSGKLADLNSINLSFDTTNIFGLDDNAQAIASYNGDELYSTVYASCRTAVAQDCNNASLQRAVNAYLMAIEQDCNTVQSALGNKQRELKTAIREGSAMLDLARIENRRKHNSDDMTACINNVESAILNEQVCGANYHKCLDNGEFIDVTTGAPIAGVVNFYELENLLKFDIGKDSVDQTLAKIPGNQTFVKNFENKTKKFATDALDKCRDIADDVWAEYLDKALLDIYYAQKSKVQQIKQGCFDFISQCYTDRDAAITAAMATLIDGNTELSLVPDKIVLTNQMCNDYVKSCNNMFDDDIIANYVNTQTTSDTVTACRAVAQQCFDSFGGTNYENFYNPSGGLFESNTVDTLVIANNHIPTQTAMDWFTLYAYDENGTRLPGYKSKCANRVAEITSCADKVEQVFGGLDSVIAKQNKLGTFGYYDYSAPSATNSDSKNAYAYGWDTSDDDSIDWTRFKNRRLRPTGVATEVYNQIIDSLQTQCMNVQGKFIEAQFIDHDRYGVTPGTTMCNLTLSLLEYGIDTSYQENMCPKDYTATTDINAWGACLCWENGGRRSKDGQFGKCAAVISTDSNTSNDEPCPRGTMPFIANGAGLNSWCTSTINPVTNQVCPFNKQDISNPSDQDSCQNNIPNDLPKGISQ